MSKLWEVDPETRSKVRFLETWTGRPGIWLLCLEKNGLPLTRHAHGGLELELSWPLTD